MRKINKAIALVMAIVFLLSFTMQANASQSRSQWDEVYHVDASGVGYFIAEDGMSSIVNFILDDITFT